MAIEERWQVTREYLTDQGWCTEPYPLVYGTYEEAEAMRKKIEEAGPGVFGGFSQPGDVLLVEPCMVEA